MYNRFFWALWYLNVFINHMVDVDLGWFIQYVLFCWLYPILKCSQLLLSLIWGTSVAWALHCVILGPRLHSPDIHE